MRSGIKRIEIMGRFEVCVRLIRVDDVENSDGVVEERRVWVILLKFGRVDIVE